MPIISYENGEVVSLEEEVEEMREALEQGRRKRDSIQYDANRYNRDKERERIRAFDEPPVVTPEMQVEVEVDAEEIVKELEGDTEEETDISFLEKETLFVVGK